MRKIRRIFRTENQILEKAKNDNEEQCPQIRYNLDYVKVRKLEC